MLTCFVSEARNHDLGFGVVFGTVVVYALSKLHPWIVIIKQAATILTWSLHIIELLMDVHTACQQITMLRAACNNSLAVPTLACCYAKMLPLQAHPLILDVTRMLLIPVHDAPYIGLNDTHTCLCCSLRLNKAAKKGRVGVNALQRAIAEGT